MKTKHLVAILAVFLCICAGASVFFFLPSVSAARAEIRSDGKVVCTVDLSKDREFTVTTENGGYNTITVKDGKIAVTDASCPDHYCMMRLWCDSGAQIVCLPNKLVITFLDDQQIDGAVG